MKILIVDDEIEITDYIEDILVEDGDFKNIVKANCAHQALRKVQNEDFDLIVLDVHMPKMDGVKFIETLKNYEEEIPKVLVFSGKITKSMLQDLIELGVKNFLTKPSSAPILLSKVQSILGKIVATS